jgi:LacI family transcriptional regulator
MARDRSIAVLVPLAFRYTREVLRGIAEFTRVHQPWRFLRDPWNVAHYHSEREVISCDGVIALEAPSDWPDIRVRPGTPWVAVADVHSGAGPRVMVNNESVGRLAARHLLECGLRQLAFCGYRGFRYSDERRAAFRRTAEEAGRAVHVYRPASRGDRLSRQAAERRNIEAWLAGLPRPVGIFAANDARAATVANACHDLGLRIPQDVAIVGVDNDDLVCEFTNPPLSSVEPDARRVGYEGAAMLLRLLHGETAPEGPILIEPRGVVKRESTDTFAAADPVVAEAFRFLRQHACEGINVQDVLKAVPVARRTLEKTSQRLLGHSPLEEIRRLQLERAKELLAATNMSMAEVAQAAGFTDAKYLSEVFQKRYTMPPTKYRRTARAEDRPR